jgi:acetyl esterase/lipase
MMIQQTATTLVALLALLPLAAPGQEDRFSQWDANKDGKLSRGELPENLRPHFGRVDRDGDGFITREEENERQRRGAGLGGREAQVPEKLEVIRDLDYGGDKNPRQALDLILRKDRAKDAASVPLIVFIHGGAWRAGSKEAGLGNVAPFVESGKFAGATINYRLSNEARWPAQIHDCKAAIRWLRAHGKEYGYDGDKIAVWGSSAGGHLVAMLGVSGGVEELEGDVGDFNDTDSRVQAVIDYFGPSEMLTMGDHESTMDHNAPDSPESLLIGGAVQEHKDAAKAASPVAYVDKEDAPFLIVHGDKDPLVPFPQSVTLDKLLDEAGVSSTLIRIEGGGHGQGFDAKALRPLIEAFLRKTLLADETAEVNEQTLGAAATGRP